MSQKYLSEFYTYKFFQPGTNRVVADPSTALEIQIQAYIQSGHAAFFEGKYAEGLNAYLCAWGLFGSGTLFAQSDPTGQKPITQTYAFTNATVHASPGSEGQKATIVVKDGDPVLRWDKLYAAHQGD